jgi:signal transduction histidine kinase
MTDDQLSDVRPEPWPLLATVVVVWVVVALVSLGVALADGDGPRLETIPWDHLVALELMSLATWVALSLPGLALLRQRGARLNPIRSLFVAAVIGLLFSLVFAAIERQLLALVTHPAQEAFAAMILPDLDARIVGFLAMVALVRVAPALAPRDTRPAPAPPGQRPATGGTSLLVTQLQSHFLFNTLNDAAELVHVDPQAADDVITRLSEFLRGALVHTQREAVALRQEVSFIRAYTEIQAVRLRDRLTVQWDIAADTLDAAVPIFVWQPILENAFRYGADPATGRLTLEIGTRREGTDLVLWVRDHGPGPDPDARRNGTGPGHGIGLRNTRDRVARLYGGSGSVEVRALEEGTAAVLRMPFEAYRGAPTQAALS